MSNSVKDNHELMRSVQEACDELDRKEIENSILQKQKEDAEYVAKITTQANEELVREIRDLNYKSGLYGTTKKYVDPRKEEVCVNERREEVHMCNCPSCQRERQLRQQHECNCHHECHHVENNKEVNIRFPFIKEHKSTFFLVMGLIIILLLASGFTPAGAFWTAIQDQWITLIADVFKIALVAIASIFIYNGVKK